MSEQVNRSISSVPTVGTLVDIVGRKLDPKRRLTVSAGWREVMGYPSYVYLVPGVLATNDGNGSEEAVGCIEIVPPPVMDARLRVLHELDEDEPERVAMERYCRDIAQSYFDTEGRIRIPERFLEYAGITESVMMSGANDRIKVWAVDEVNENTKIDFEAFKKARIAMRPRKRGV
ncbi:MAG: hypothetical protein PHO37_07970 [Kiritimatiellae bacterium]|nr:hypothetical protein [Kiritimatiellia bacterium]